MQTEPQNVIDPSGMPTFYTPTPVWIMLADIRPQAKIAWMFLAEHANVGRQMGMQKLPCPKMETIAKAVGTSRQRLREYFNELKAIGALVVEEYRYAGGMRRGYRYRPIFNPPASYSGPSSLREFYDRRDGSQFEWMAHRQEAANQHETAGQPGGCQLATVDSSHPATVDGAQTATAQGKPVQENPVQEKSLSPVVAKVKGARGRASAADERETIPTADKPTTVLPAQRAEEPRQHPQEPAQTPATTAERVVQAAAILQPNETPAFIAWATARHQPRTPAWWRTVAKQGDLPELVAAWRSEAVQGVSQPAIGVVLPAWCGQCDGEEVPRRWREDNEGRAYRCPVCHPDAMPVPVVSREQQQTDAMFDRAMQRAQARDARPLPGTDTKVAGWLALADQLAAEDSGGGTSW